MSSEMEQLFAQYVEELRTAKAFAEQWWTSLLESANSSELELSPEELWPMGAVSHPRVIAVYRKYYLQCVAVAPEPSEKQPEPSGEGAWGHDDAPPPAGRIEPKVFVLDLLAGGETNDLYDFLLSLVFVPIGIKSGEVV